MSEIYEKQKDSIKNWRANNREKYNAYMREYRHKKQAEGTWTHYSPPEYFKQYREKRNNAVKELQELKEKLKNIL